MTKAEALRRIAELHDAWAIKYGDSVPSSPVKDPVWNADMNAPPATLDELNQATQAILAQVTP